MKFLIIIPTHNEEENILFCLKSLENQTFKDFKTVVVNDGSTDKTREIVENFINHQPSTNNYQLKNLDFSKHEPGAKVARTFNKGLETQNLDEFEIICKFDADIVFPENYLEEINKIYEQNPKSGMVSGLVYINKNSKTQTPKNPNTSEGWEFENLSSKNHVRGPIKSYRKECFLAMKGLRPVLGWDNIDVMLAKMNGFEVITNKEIWVKHLRPTAYKYKKQKAEKLGEYFYNIGLSFPLMLISSAKSSLKNKSISEFFRTIKSFKFQKHKKNLTDEEINFIQTLKWKEFKKKIF